MTLRIGRFDKDPDAVLDWRWDWSQWLEDGETLLAADVFVDGESGGLEVDETIWTLDDVTAWISGGAVGSVATLTCRITTSVGRTDDRSIRIRVRQR